MFGGKTEKPQMDNKKKMRIVLLVVFAVLVLAFVAVGMIFLNEKDQEIVRVIESGTALTGISVNGVDISGMTSEQAKDATADIPQALLDDVQISLDVNGEIYTYDADAFSVSTDYQEVLVQAIAYGHTGTFEERRQAADKAKVEGIDLTVSLCMDDAQLKSVLAQLKQTLDQPPQDATVIFTPCGHEADGTIFEPDLKEMADAHAKGKQIERPELVRRDETETMNPLRYQFWNEDEYEEGYIPKDADIARFLYTPDVQGVVADTDAITDEIKAQVQSGAFSTINVPIKMTDAEVTLAQLKEDTQLITSWTSSYRDHSGSNRNWNVSRMSSFVNGNEISPGKEWSVNKTAGPRNASTAREIGWKKAGGLYQGGTTQQYGGGVCQLGSTTYNAALRADLTIVEFYHHSDPSGYIPKGLDATLNYMSLNSTDKDLVLKNDGEMPVYLVSYVDPEKEIVTVEVYGRLPYSEQHQQHVIYDYTSDNIRRYGMGSVRTVENTVAPDGHILTPEAPTYEFSKPARGYKVDVYKHVYALDGTQLDKTFLRESNYSPKGGWTYIYPPHLMPPEPTPDPTDPGTGDGTDTGTDTGTDMGTDTGA